MEERDAAFDATAFHSPEDNLPEPLCAIYEPNLLSEILSNSNLLPTNSPRDLLMQSKVKVIDAKNPNALKNMNYPGNDLSEIESWVCDHWARILTIPQTWKINGEILG